MRSLTLATALASSLLLPSGAFGQAGSSAITRDAQGHPTVRALRVGEAIVVDGRLSERFYETALPFDDLILVVASGSSTCFRIQIGGPLMTERYLEDFQA